MNPAEVKKFTEYARKVAKKIPKATYNPILYQKKYGIQGDTAGGLAWVMWFLDKLEGKTLVKYTDGTMGYKKIK